MLASRAAEERLNAETQRTPREQGLADVVEWKDAAASRRYVLRARRVWLRIEFDAPPEDASEQDRLAS